MSENSNRGAIAVKLSRIFNKSILRQPALQLIYDTAPIGLAVLSLDCRYLQLNQRLTEICGISVEDHLGRSVRDCVPALADAVEGIVRSIMSTGEPVAGIEVTSQRTDKTEDRWWVTYWHPLRDPKGEIVGVNVAAEEITERKRAEAVLAANDKALRESELRFRELADNISQFAWTADASGWIYWYNKRWHDYTGTTFEDVEGWGWQKVPHPEHVDRVVERIRRSFETGTPWEDTFPLRGKDGSYRWFLSRALPIRNEAGDVIRWFGTNTDVTEQIEAEAALRESETRFRELADNISQFAWTADAKGWIYWYNKRWHDYTGTTLEDMHGWGWQKVHHPEHVDRVVQRIRQSFEIGTPWEDTFPLRSKDGTYRWFLSRALPIRNEAGEVVRWFGTNTDVTEQIEAQNALRESETRFRELADNISQFAWTADAKGWIYWYNKRWHDYTGTTLEDMQGWGWQKVHHPEHVDRVVQRIRQSFENGTPWEDTFPLRGKDGTYRWFLSRALPIRNEAGEVVRWFGTNTDVTEQIEVENALRESETRFRELADNISQFAWTADAKGWIYWYNKRWHDYTGTTLEDMQGWGWQKVHHPEHVDRVVQRIRQSFEIGTPWEDTFPLRSK